MVFRKKKPKRLYYPTSRKWYNQPRKKARTARSRKVMANNIRKRFSKFIKNTIYFTIIGAVLVVFILLLLFSSYLSITNIEVVREDFNIDTATITNDLNKYVGRNILFFPRSRAVNTIHESFPEFASIKVSKVFPNTLKIQLESHAIIANLRAYYILPKAEEVEDDITIREVQDALDTAFNFEMEEEDGEEEEPIEQKCILNRIGQAIFDQEENLELITIAIDGLVQPIEDREMVIPEEHMDYILDAIHYFNNTFEMQVRSLKYFPIAREVHIKTNTNMYVWLTMEKEYKKQIDKLNTIYEAAEFDKEDIGYIDLRVREKVIYCPVNSRCNR